MQTKGLAYNLQGSVPGAGCESLSSGGKHCPLWGGLEGLGNFCEVGVLPTMQKHRKNESGSNSDWGRRTPKVT